MKECVVVIGSGQMASGIAQVFATSSIPVTMVDVIRGLALGMNHPMGPLALADLIGLDTCVAILGVLQDGLGDPKYRACPLLMKYVAAAWFGRKSGRGFYTY